jgi:hypothetical protein
MMMVMWMLDGIVVNSKILVQRVVCYFITDTLALNE